jgi:hypothetical protein
VALPLRRFTRNDFIGIFNMNKALNELQITNQCVLVCDLGQWRGEESPAWTLLSGTQDEVGKDLSAQLARSAVNRLDDFGGVSASFLCREDRYAEQPPLTKPGGAVFSFTPKKRLIAEGSEMARVASLSGYSLLIITIQKHDKYGKVWVLLALLRHLPNGTLTYFEDTNTVVDELKSSPEATRVVAVHVLAPGFEDYSSQRADRVVSQLEYQREVLR